MKTPQKGFIAPLLLALIALLLIGGGAYVYVQNKQTIKSVVTSPITQTAGWHTLTIPTLHIALDIPDTWVRFDATPDSVILGTREEVGDGGFGSWITIQATSSGLNGSHNSFGLDGTKPVFDALQIMPDGKQTKNDSATSTDIFTKISNSTVSGYQTVTIHSAGAVFNSGAAHNDTVSWIKSDGMNWYIDVSDFSPDKYKTVFDQVVGSIRITQ